jgi:hypothetical protein
MRTVDEPSKQSFVEWCSRRGHSWITALGACAIVLSGCSDVPTSDDGALGEVQQALHTTVAFDIRLPNAIAPEEVTLAASRQLRVSDRAAVRSQFDDFFGTVVSTGSNQTELGADAVIGTLWSSANVFLRERARIEGHLRTQGNVTTQNNVVITGTTTAATSFGALRSTAWELTLPDQTGGNASLEPDQSRTLAPGGYGDAFIKSRATLRVSSGIYRFGNFSLEPSATLRVDDSAGPVVIVVDGSFMFRGSIADSSGAPKNDSDLLVIARSEQMFPIEARFAGSIYAPNGQLVLGTVPAPGHIGSFIARDIEVRADTRVTQRPFPFHCAFVQSCSAPPAAAPYAAVPQPLRGVLQNYVTAALSFGPDVVEPASAALAAVRSQASQAIPAVLQEYQSAHLARHFWRWLQVDLLARLESPSALDELVSIASAPIPAELPRSPVHHRDPVTTEHMIRAAAVRGVARLAKLGHAQARAELSALVGSTRRVARETAVLNYLTIGNRAQRAQELRAVLPQEDLYMLDLVPMSDNFPQPPAFVP